MSVDIFDIFDIFVPITSVSSTNFFQIDYNWSIPETFTLNYTWDVTTSVIKGSPTIITSGPQNSINRPTLFYPNGRRNNRF